MLKQNVLYFKKRAGEEAETEDDADEDDETVEASVQTSQNGTQESIAEAAPSEQMEVDSSPPTISNERYSPKMIFFESNRGVTFILL